MTRVARPTLVACIALLIAAIPATAVRVDPIAPQTRASSESSPPPVESVEDTEAAAPPSLLDPAIILEQTLAALDAHLLITGRPVQLEDSTGEPEPEVAGQAPVATPFHYHPATVFEVAMGTVIALVGLSLVWLPSLRRGRPRRYRGHRAGRHRGRSSSRSVRQAAPHSERTRVRRRSRRAIAD